MTTPHSLSDSRSEPACAALEPLLPLVSHHLLEPEEERQLQAHVAGCAHCRATLAAYDRLDAALRRRFEPVGAHQPHTEESMKKIKEAQEQEAPFAPVPRLRQRPAFRAGRVFSWVGAIAAVLAIALIATALVVSHHPTSTVKVPGNTGQGQPGIGVYYTLTTSGASSQTSIYALDPATGKVRWHVPAPAGVGVTPLLVDHGVLYVLAEDYNQAPDADGSSKPDPTRGTSAKNAVYAFRASDGKLLWHQQTGGIPSAIKVADGGVYVTTLNGNVLGLNASTGAVRWHVSVGSALTFIQVAGGLVYLNIYPNTSKNPAGGKVLALSATNGAEKWHVDLHGTAGTIQVLSGTAGNFQAQNGLVAVVDVQVDANSKDGTASSALSVLDASTGSLKWTYSGDPRKVGSVFVRGDTVFVALMDSSGSKQQLPYAKLQALNASDGSLRWEKAYDHFTLAYINQGAQDGPIYLNTATTIFALNAQDGSEAWHQRVGAYPSLDQLTANTLFAEAQSQVYALNVADGSVRWHTSLGGSAYLSAAAGQQVFAMQKATDPQSPWMLRFIALNALNGAQLWHLDFTSAPSQPFVG